MRYLSARLVWGRYAGGQLVQALRIARRLDFGRQRR
jgi:hypothetical protein